MKAVLFVIILFMSLKGLIIFFKIKPTKEIICKVINLIEGTGKYEGMLGALTVETSDKKIFNVGSGFIDVLRYMIWNVKSADYIDKFVKIKYQDLSEYGILVFLFLRGLKNDSKRLIDNIARQWSLP